VIVGVRRGGYEAQLVSPSEIVFAGSTLSMRQASLMFPKYSIRSGTIIVKPNPTTAYSAIVSFVNIHSLSIAITTATGTTDEYSLANYSNILINYAAALDLLGVAGQLLARARTDLYTAQLTAGTNLAAAVASLPTWTSPTLGSTLDAVLINLSYTAPAGYSLPVTITPTQALPQVSPPVITLSAALPTQTLTTSITVTASLPTFNPPVLALDFSGFTDAVAKAQNTIDDSGAIDAESFLTADDPEMVNVTVSVAAEEVSRARVELEKQNILLQEFSQNIQYEVNRIQSEVAIYKTETEKEIAEANLTLQAYQSNLAYYKTELEKEIANAQTQLQAYQNEVAAYGADVQKEVAEANAYIQSYDLEQKNSISTMQAAVQDAQLEIQHWESKSKVTIERYMAAVNKEAARVQAEIQKLQLYIATAQGWVSYANLANSNISGAGLLTTQSRALMQQARQELQDYLASLGLGSAPQEEEGDGRQSSN
jgi:hypothetical protein